MISDTVQLALIASIAPTLVAILNYLQGRKTQSAITTVKEQTNHIKDQLVAATALASHAAGVTDEKLRAAVEQGVPIKQNSPTLPPAAPPPPAA